MRLAAQTKGGYYPAPPSAIADLCMRLHIPRDGQKRAVLDPCCGRGLALSQIVGSLAIPPAGVYAVELDLRRGQAAAEALPKGATVRWPADFQDVEATYGSFSFVWCNPPYDHELGGGRRMEQTFAFRSTQLLVPGGVLALALPERWASSWDIRRVLLSWYDRLSIFPYPAADRKFNEVIILGVKRKQPVEAFNSDWDKRCTTQRAEYDLPPAPGPRRFEKNGMTDAEVAVALEKSKLQSIFAPAKESEPPRPPLQLSAGQRALVLAGGLLNGIIRKPGKQPICIKATPFKEEYTKSVEERTDGKTDADGDAIPGESASSTVTVISERIKLKVRVLCQDGQIKELTNG